MFKLYTYDNFIDIDTIIQNEKINYFYNIKYGTIDNMLVKNCKNLIHITFRIQPH